MKAFEENRYASNAPYTTDFGMEKEQYYGDGVITGYGTINGRLVYVLLKISPFLWSFIRNACRENLQLWIWLSKMGANDRLNDSGGATYSRRCSFFRGYADIFIEMCNQVCNANISYHGTMRWWRAVYSPHD
jgi:acetyl-CoA carboxylase carboxyltransferase component